MKKIIIPLFLVSLVFIASGCGTQKVEIENEITPTTTTPTVIKQPTLTEDPVQEFCQKNNYEFIVRFDPETKSSGSFCRFPDMTECPAQKFFNGTCSPGQENNSQINPEEVNIFAACDTTYEPVCGHDGLTYTNSCLAQIQGIIIAHDGVCTMARANTPQTHVGGTTGDNNQDLPYSDLPPTVDTSVPNWMGVVKDFILSSPANTPRAFIEKCNYNDKIYYFQSDGCTDCFSIL